MVSHLCMISIYNTWVSAFNLCGYTCAANGAFCLSVSLKSLLYFNNRSTRFIPDYRIITSNSVRKVWRHSSKV